MAGKVEKKVQALCARPTGLERSRKKTAVRTRGTKQSPPKKRRFGFARVANCSSPHDSTHACKNNPEFGLALRLRGEETANKNEQNHPKPLQELFFFLAKLQMFLSNKFTSKICSFLFYCFRRDYRDSDILANFRL